MTISRRNFLASTSAVALTAALPAEARLLHGSVPAAALNAPVVVNFGGASPAFFTNTYLNMAKLWNPVSSMVGWPGILGGTNGYPNGNITSNAGGLIYPDPVYYGHYILSWTDSGGTGAVGHIDSNTPTIIYSGGANVFGLGGSSGEIIGNTAVVSSGSGVNVEFAYGLLIGAVGTDSSLGPTNIKFTSTGTNFAFGISTGLTMKFNNLTYNGGAFPAGPNSDGSWTVYNIDFNNFALQGSSSLNFALIALNTSGTVGVNTEGIYSNGSTYPNPILFGNWTGANASNLIWCKKADLTDINAGKIVTQAMADTWKNLSPAYIRFMDQLGTQQILQPDYARRVIPASRTWGTYHTPTAYWGGVMTNSSDTFTCPTNPSASPASGAFVDNEVVIAQVSASGQNTTQNPKLGITGRTGTAPIYDNGPHLLNITMTGSVPPSGTVLSFLFTGGGLTSPFTYNYTTSTSVNGPAGVPDTTLQFISFNIRVDLQGNVRGNSTPISATTIFCANASISGSLMSFYYNQNISTSGTASLGAGFSIVGNDPTSNVVFTSGFMPAGYMPNNAVCTFTYNALLQAWICEPGDGAGAGGVIGGPPLEFCAELCARAGSGVWLNIGMLDSPTTIFNKVTLLAQATFNGQPAVSNLAVEYGNETWNNQLGCNAITVAQAAALGININTGGGYVSHGLRTIQMAAQATAAWAAAGRSRSSLKIVNAYQYTTLNSAGTSDNSVYRFNGTGLDASGTGTNVVLKAYGGGGATAITTNYSAAPNRPVDWCDWISPATYWQGAQYSATGNGLSGGVLADYNGSLLAAYNYAYGNSTQQQAALDFLSNAAATSGDMYNGTLAGASEFTTSVFDWSVGSGQAFAAGYFGVGTVASSYDTSRSSTGTSGGAQAKLGVACYEGGLQSGPTFPTQLVASLNSFAASTFAASITSNVMTVTGSVTGLPLTVGQVITTPTGQQSTISSFGTGSGGSGTYNMTTIPNFGSATMTGGYPSGYSAALPGAAAGPSGSGDTSTTAAANLYNLFIAWKNDTRYANLVTQQFNQYRAAVRTVSTRDALASWYGFQGPTIWAMWPGLADQSAPFQVYNAVAAWR